MKHLIPTLVLAILSGCASHIVTKDQATERLSTYKGPVCLVAAKDIDAPYKVLGKALAVKNTYGTIEEVVPVFVKKVRSMGGNVVLSYQNTQRFKGPMLHKAVVPQARGLVVFVEQEFSCDQFGGKEF